MPGGFSQEVSGFLAHLAGRACGLDVLRDVGRVRQAASRGADLLGRCPLFTGAGCWDLAGGPVPAAVLPRMRWLPGSWDVW